MRADFGRVLQLVRCSAAQSKDERDLFPIRAIAAESSMPSEPNGSLAGCIANYSLVLITTVLE